MKTNEEIKQEIITELKGDGDISSYIDGQEYLTEDDWQDISNAVGLDIYYDPSGLTYTSKGVGAYCKMKTFRKDDNEN